MKKRTVGSFDGPFAPMLDLFVKQKQALGYDYVGGYNALHVFDTFSKRYEVKNYELSKEIVLAWAQKRKNIIFHNIRHMYSPKQILRNYLFL